MVFNDLRKNEDKGFSLVELIVVIAIMAVMVAVLAPSLLSYVEKSRAQKDDSAMGEVVNAIQIAMSEESVFNEVLAYSCYGNYSCYVDATATTAGLDKYEIETKAKNENGLKDWSIERQWTYDEEARKDDEVPYDAAGAMRGVTLTFVPEKNSNGNFTYNMKNAIVNDMLSDKADGMMLDSANAPIASVKRQNGAAAASTFVSANVLKAEDKFDVADKIILSTMTTSKRGDHYLYNAVKSTVGDSIDLSSKTYRNSEYTVFIRIGSVGGKSAGGDSIKVYGQWNGTNLSTAG